MLLLFLILRLFIRLIFIVVIITKKSFKPCQLLELINLGRGSSVFFGEREMAAADSICCQTVLQVWSFPLSC